MNRLILLSAALLGLSACGRPESVAPAVQAADAWCRPSPNGARVGACYVTLTAATDDRFTTFSTPAAGRPEIHTMSTEGGVMRMRALPEGLALPAGEAVALRPGAEHLMLIDLAAPLVEGASVPLTLSFESAPAITVQAAVRAPVSAPAHGAGH